MKANQKIQQGQGDRTTIQKKSEGNKGQSSTRQIRKNEDVSVGDMGEEPKPGPSPSPNPDTPPNPSRREYEDPDHEHTHREPSAGVIQNY